jgi:hypothetical protein
MKYPRHLQIVGMVAAMLSTTASAGVMLGAHAGLHSSHNSEADVAALEQAIGRKLAIDNDHEDWTEFPNLARIRWDDQNGRLAMLSWRISFHLEGPSGGCATADAITSGVYDAQMQRQALALKSVGHRVLVRFNWEMTNNPVNTCFTGFRVRDNEALAGSKYIAAWRHVVDKFRAVGATNVEWIWAPGHKAYTQGVMQKFYPGSNYVDWIGVDYYNKGDTPMSFASDPGILEFYREAAPLGKPLMIAETGAVNDPKLHPDPQTLWITTAREFLKSRPAIKAFLWWNAAGQYAHDYPNYGGSGYVLQGAGLAAFRAMANDPYFK